ncbi:MAG: FG-GAP repeat domain-containing protein, partial [Acidobacteriota bacterium]
MLRKVAALMGVVLLSGSAAWSQSLFFPSRNDFDTGATFADNFTALGIRLATGDFDGDGNLDVVVVNEFGIQPPGVNKGESLAVLLGDGRGLFLPASFLLLELNTFAGDVVTGDFNGDTFLDIAAAVEDLDGTTGGGGTGPGTVGGVAVFNGDGTGSFAAPQLIPGGNMEPGFTGLVAGRINGDSIDDIVLLNTLDGTFTVYLGASPGPPVPAAGSPVATCSNPVAADLGNLNALPGMDLAIVCDPPGSGSEEIQLFNNAGNGAFTPFTNPPVSTTLVDPRAVVIADLNGDGANDLAMANSFLEAMMPMGSVSFLKGDGIGNFTEDFIGGFAQPVGDNPRSIQAGDVDGDGDMDLVVANWGLDDISILKASLTGTGSAASPSYKETFFAAGIRVFDAVFADLDGRGNLDLLAVNGNEFDGTLSAYLGGGSDLIQRATRFSFFDPNNPNII